MLFNKKKSDKSSSRSKRDFVAKILSVVAAVALWLYVVDFQNTVEEKTIHDVPVMVEQLELSTGMTVVSGMNYSIDVVVRGSKSELKKLTNQSISAMVDKRDYDSLGENRCDIKIKTPENITVVSCSVQNINVTVENLHEKSFEITAVPLQYKLAPGHQIESVIPKESHVTVSGPESLINKVCGAQIRIVRDDVIDNSISDSSEKIVLVDENDNIINDAYLIVSPEYSGYEINVARDLALENVSVSIKNDESVSKKFFIEFSNTNTIDLVNLLCNKEVSERIDNTDIIAFVDVSGIDSEGEFSLPVEFKLPDGVMLSDNSKYFLDVTSSKMFSKTCLVNVFDASGASPDFTYLLSNDLVCVSGPKESIDLVSSVCILVDLSEVEESNEIESEVVLFNSHGKIIDDSKLSVDVPYITVNVLAVYDEALSLNVDETVEKLMSLVDSNDYYHSADNTTYELLVK